MTPDSSPQPMVSVRGVHKFFGDLHVLRGIDLDIASGEVCVILGPSGSGKSTLLRCLNQLERISAGRVYVDGTLLGYREDASGQLHDLKDREIAAQNKGRRIVLISHGASIRILFADILSMPVRAIWHVSQFNTAVNRIRFEDDGFAAITLMNDTAHLSV